MLRLAAAGDAGRRRLPCLPLRQALRRKRTAASSGSGRWGSSSLRWRAANLSTDDAAVHLRNLLTERGDGAEVFKQAMCSMDERQRTRIALGWAVGELKSEFQKADANRDGSLTVDEFVKWGEEITVKGAAEPEAQEATSAQLRLLAMRTMAPYIGFGMVDNGLMVISGEVIDAYLGAMFGISTMAAAALGNAFSNGIGMGMHGAIERAAASIGLKDPKLSMEQMQQRRVHLAKTCSAIVGIVGGCLLGMFPLLFMSSKSAAHDPPRDPASEPAGG